MEPGLSKLLFHFAAKKYSSYLAVRYICCQQANLSSTVLIGKQEDDDGFLMSFKT